VAVEVGEGEGRLEFRQPTDKFQVGGINIDQLALALAERLKPAEVELPFFGELADAWLEHIRPNRVAPGNEERLVRRLVPLFLETEKTLTAAMVIELVAKQDDYGPATKNKLIATGRLIVEWAQASQKWNRPNPFEQVKREKEPPRKYEMLTLEELYQVQLQLRPDRLREFRVALHMGFRPGEQFALEVEKVDWQQKKVHVDASWDRDETKTGVARDVPIHPAIYNELLDACVAAKGKYVFGHAHDGSMQSRNTKLTRTLQTAMIKAGVGIVGVEYKCRRKGCEYVETRMGPHDKRVRPRCPECSFKLIAVPFTRDVRWYDLRHMCSTFHHHAGADNVCRALALGHSLEGITDEKYTHPTLQKMAAELSKWKLAKPPSSSLQPMAEPKPRRPPKVWKKKQVDDRQLELVTIHQKSD
jgi:integrase